MPSKPPIWELNDILFGSDMCGLAFEFQLRFLSCSTTPSGNGLIRTTSRFTSRHMMTSSKHFPRYWLFVQGIHRWPVDSPHKGQWRRTLMLYLICTWINGWINNREASDLRCHGVHCVVTVITLVNIWCWDPSSGLTSFIYRSVIPVIKWDAQISHC